MIEVKCDRNYNEVNIFKDNKLVFVLSIKESSMIEIESFINELVGLIFDEGNDCHLSVSRIDGDTEKPINEW